MKWIVHPIYKNYEFSDNGNYRHVKRKKDRKKHLDRMGYNKVDIRHEGKLICKTLHSVIAELFIGKRPYGFVVNHKDGVKDNNKLDNLEYIYPRENSNHHSKGKYMKGAKYDERCNRWYSQIRFNGKVTHIGMFSTELEASEAYLKYTENLKQSKYAKSRQ